METGAAEIGRGFPGLGGVHRSPSFQFLRARAGCRRGVLPRLQMSAWFSMPRKRKDEEATLSPEARARYGAWLEIQDEKDQAELEAENRRRAERGQQPWKSYADKLRAINRERAKLNRLPASEKAKINEEKAKHGDELIRWPLKPWKCCKVWNNQHRRKIARKACALTEAERKWSGDRTEGRWKKLLNDPANRERLQKLRSGELLREIQAEIANHERGEFLEDIKAGRRTEEQIAQSLAFSREVLRKAKDGTLEAEIEAALVDDKERQEIEDENQRYQEIHIAWDNGEERRFVNEWKAKARSHAEGIIAGRGKVPEMAGFSVEAFFPSAYGPAWLDTQKVEDEAGNERNLNEKEKESWREHYKRGEMWLAPFYEYARQSVRWLVWARMLTTQAKDRHYLICHMATGDVAETLPKVGRAAIDALRALATHLAGDVPFSEIPLTERKGAAGILADGHNIAVDPDHYTTVDAGEPESPWLRRLIQREKLRLAGIEEATQTTEHAIAINTSKMKDCIPYTCRHVLRATTQNHLYLPLKRGEKWEDGTSEIKQRGNDDLASRAINQVGAEVLVVWVNWNGTSNQDLGDAFARMAASLRPAKWPEPETDTKSDKQTVEKMIRVLVWHRLSASYKACDPKTQLELRNRIGSELNALKKELRARDKMEAAKYFQDLTGEDSTPWWVKRVEK